MKPMSTFLYLSLAYPSGLTGQQSELTIQASSQIGMASSKWQWKARVRNIYLGVNFFLSIQCYQQVIYNALQNIFKTQFIMGSCAGSTKNRPLSAFPSLTHPLQQQCLNCNLCAMPFNLSDRCPMMLCLNQHNACRTCIKQLTTTLSVNCPFCRTEFNPKTVSCNRILMEILGRKDKTVTNDESKEESEQQRLQRVLGEARSQDIQKVIYLIEVGANLANIRELHLWNLSLTSIIDLSLFTGLKTLDLRIDKNQIAEIKNIQQLTQLTYLNLGYNQITTIKSMQTLHKLEFLDLCHNKISKIQNLVSLKALHTLNLNYNLIEIVENLYQLPKLTILYLKSNPICPRRNCGSMKALQHRGVILQVAMIGSNIEGTASPLQ